MISIPAGVIANQQTESKVVSTLTNAEAALNLTSDQITCTLASSSGSSNFPNFTGFGGYSGSASGSRPSFGFGGGSAFGGGEATAFNETEYSDINDTILLTNVSAVQTVLAVEEGQNETFTFNGNSFTRLVPNYIIEGVSLTSDLIDNGYSTLPTNITEGTTLQAGETNEVLLSENNSKYFGVGVGNTVDILGTNFTVVGVYTPSNVEDTQVLYMSLLDAQSITNETDYITSFVVFADSPSDVNTVVTELQNLYPALNVNTAESMLSAENTELASAESSLSSTTTTALEEIVIVVVATSLIVLFVMLYTVKERTKEIGTLKAIGFSNKTVMGQFMLEGVFLSVIAGIVGIAIGFVAAPTLASALLPSVSSSFSRAAGFGESFRSSTTASTTTTTATLTPELVLIGLAVAILLGIVGSLYPAWRAAKIKPAEAMRYE